MKKPQRHLMKLLMYKIITRKAFISITWVFRVVIIIYSPYNNKTTLIGFIIRGLILCLILGDREIFFFSILAPLSTPITMNATLLIISKAELTI